MARFRSRIALSGPALLALLAACGPPPEAQFPDDPARPEVPRPQLTPTENFDGALELAGSDTTGIETGTAALEARAEALRTRAAALTATPVIPPDDAARLERGATP